MDKDKLDYLIDKVAKENKERETLLNRIENKDYDLDTLLPFESDALNYEQDIEKRQKGNFIIEIIKFLSDKLDQYSNYVKIETDFGYDLYFTYNGIYYLYSIMMGQGTEESIQIIDKNDNDYYIDLSKEKVVDRYDRIIRNKKVYLGGDLLSTPMVEYRKKQKDEINGILGVQAYSPSDDKSINDKSNAVQDKLAERILNNDYNAMLESDVYTFDILNHATGTIAELSILLGMKRQARITIERLSKIAEFIKNDTEQAESYQQIQNEIKEQQEFIDRPVFVYSTDIREGNGHTYNDPYRTEVSFNQFLYGEILEVTNGVGFISWEQVKKELEKLGHK
ncbi:nucleoside 2-deoxyribosyltransferase [Staphylococcus phage Alsa_3]|nr:nucleoside 2-deoxyribosyltransferase [Staphylococcus phage Alsa_3]WNM51218.1 nucleoside 2-deoxyribosyltransferase [Staphylococcus phage Alsa_4]